MPRFRRFEDIPVWQDARVLARNIYRITRQAPFSRDHGLVDQIRRAAVSVASNIAEGHERGTTRDLIQFLFYAKGSAGEVRSQLYTAEDVGYLSADDAEAIRAQAAAISRQIHHWTRSMQAIDFDPGPSRHIGPSNRARKWEQRLEELGMVRLPDGRYRKRKPEQTE